jgi:hypothetical protein
MGVGAPAEGRRHNNGALNVVVSASTPTHIELRDEDAVQGAHPDAAAPTCALWWSSAVPAIPRVDAPGRWHVGAQLSSPLPPGSVQARIAAEDDVRAAGSLIEGANP